MDSGKRFATPSEEIEHWRSLAQKFKQELEESKEELEEYQISSRELEAELETQLKQLEKRNRELEATSSKLQQEVDSLRGKLDGLQKSSHKKTAELEDNLAQVSAYKNELQRYIRELEQANDDLERAKRATVVSLEDFEMRLNQAIERNAFLENELDEKETLAETVQRLKDEARDLKSEIDVKQRTVPVTGAKAGEATSTPCPPSDSIKMADSGYAGHQNQPPSPTTPTTPTGKTTPTTPVARGVAPSANGATPLTPSARISALNIVSDLLRKVGALENKLANCKNFVKDPPRSSRVTSSTASAQRTKRFTRGSSIPTPAQPGLKLSV